MEDKNNNMRENLHKIEMKVSHHEIKFIQTDKKLGKIEVQLDKHSGVIDKLVTRMTVIAAFLTGVLVVASDTGGSVLRTLLGALL